MIIIIRLTNNEFIRDYKPTFGPDFCVKELFIEEKKYTLQVSVFLLRFTKFELWDTEGKQRFQYVGDYY